MPKQEDKIFVTKSHLPSLDKYNQYLKQIWKSGVLTNNGYFTKKLEEKLKKYLGVKHLFFVSNGTVGLQIAIKALNLKKEIITTPFTYVATIDSILWENCKPVFVDIDEKTLCIDVSKIEEKISKNTEAILAVHIYGNSCDVEAIEKIAKKHKIKVIYDAAHAFGAEVNGQSVLNYGDVSVLSFHATKLFHTAEGGAIVTDDDEIAKKIYLYRSFGHPDVEIESVGINGKNSEIHAALGLCNLEEIEDIIVNRKKVSETYDEYLDRSFIEQPINRINSKNNFAYYPVIFKSEQKLLDAKKLLEANNIFPRRYFYPSLNELPFVKGDRCPISESISRRILCLPLYDTLAIADVVRISEIINRSQEELPKIQNAYKMPLKPIFRPLGRFTPFVNNNSYKQREYEKTINR